MVKTLKYLFKERLLFIGIITVICLFIVMVSLSHSVYWEWNYKPIGPDSFDEVQGPSTSPLYLLTVIAAILVTFIPVYEFGFKMNKISIDQMYSLPVKREKLYLSRLIIGFIEVMIPFTVVTVYSLFDIMKNDHFFNLIYYIPFYFSQMFMTFCVYTIISFMFTRGNSKFDGIMNIIYSIFLINILLMIVDAFVLRSENINEAKYFLYSPMNNVAHIFDCLLGKDRYLEIYDSFKIEYLDDNIISICVYTLIAIAAFVLFIILNKKEKAENSMQISESWFSYRVFIPIYAAIFTSMICASGDFMIALMVIGVGGFINYVIFRRSIKIKKVDFIVLAIAFIVGAFFGLYVFRDNGANFLPF